MISRAKYGAGGAGTHRRRPFSVGPVLPRAGSSGLAGAAGLVVRRAAKGGEHDQQWLHLGRTLSVVLIIFVVTMGSCLR